MIVAPGLVRVASEMGQWLAGRRRRYRVDGASMEPTLAEGEFVLVALGRRPRPGDLVLARHPERPDLSIVKRVGGMVDGRFVLVSDNESAGTDSRTWGPLDPALIEGTVTLVLDRPLASSVTSSATRRQWPWPRWLQR